MEMPHAVESDITYGPQNTIYRRLPARRKFLLQVGANSGVRSEQGLGQCVQCLNWRARRL